MISEICGFACACAGHYYTTTTVAESYNLNYVYCLFGEVDGAREQCLAAIAWAVNAGIKTGIIHTAGHWSIIWH